MKSRTDGSYYVYGLYDREQCFYVGITNNPARRLDEHISEASKFTQSMSVYAKIREALSNGITPHLLVWEEQPSRRQALLREEFLIRYIRDYAGVPIVNVMNGGRIAPQSLVQMFHTIYTSKAIRKTNKSGVNGVSWSKRLSKWRVQIMTKLHLVHLGYFADKEEAVRVRGAAEELRLRGKDPSVLALKKKVGRPRKLTA